MTSAPKSLRLFQIIRRRTVGKVAEVLLGQRIRDPLSIDHLALGKRDVDRVWDSVFEVVRLEICGGEHEGIKAKLVILAIYTTLL